MPALVNSRVGSSAGTRLELGTSRCPRALKNWMNLARMSADFIRSNIVAPPPPFAPPLPDTRDERDRRATGVAWRFRAGRRAGGNGVRPRDAAQSLRRCL